MHIGVIHLHETSWTLLIHTLVRHVSHTFTPGTYECCTRAEPTLMHAFVTYVGLLLFIYDAASPLAPLSLYKCDPHEQPYLPKALCCCAPLRCKCSPLWDPWNVLQPPDSGCCSLHCQIGNAICHSPCQTPDCSD